MPRKKSPSRTRPSTRSTGRRAKATAEATEPNLLRRILWLLAAAAWVFVAVSLAGFDIADWPSTSVARHAEPASNPAGIVGSLIAWWSYVTLGWGAWLVLGMAAVALVTIVRGYQITHPLVRTLGTLLAAVMVGGLHDAWIVSMWPQAGAIPGLEAGLVPAELDIALATRFGPVGASLILLTGLLLGLLVAADELLLRVPAAMVRSLEAARGIDLDPVRAAISAPFRGIGNLTERFAARRSTLQPAGVPPEMVEAWLNDEARNEEEEEEEEEDDDD